jgi:hypothetical protein
MFLSYLLLLVATLVLNATARLNPRGKKEARAEERGPLTAMVS